ncbi:Uncharacterised protein [Mycobacteroides abscessus subsp. abscessus]|nr:Uncharacterised protein [Mycobacteroides abscessus subsp. abscessus]
MRRRLALEVIYRCATKASDQAVNAPMVRLMAGFHALTVVTLGEMKYPITSSTDAAAAT